MSKFIEFIEQDFNRKSDFSAIIVSIANKDKYEKLNQYDIYKVTSEYDVVSLFGKNSLIHNSYMHFAREGITSVGVMPIEFYYDDQYNFDSDKMLSSYLSAIEVLDSINMASICVFPYVWLDTNKNFYMSIIEKISTSQNNPIYIFGSSVLTGDDTHDTSVINAVDQISSNSYSGDSHKLSVCYVIDNIKINYSSDNKRAMVYNNTEYVFDFPSYIASIFLKKYPKYAINEVLYFSECETIENCSFAHAVKRSDGSVRLKNLKINNISVHDMYTVLKTVNFIDYSLKSNLFGNSKIDHRSVINDVIAKAVSKYGNNIITDYSFEVMFNTFDREIIINIELCLHNNIEKIYVTVASSEVA